MTETALNLNDGTFAVVGVADKYTLPEPIPEHLLDAPLKIYLHTCDSVDCDHTFKEHQHIDDGVAWSADNADGAGIPYVRADQMQAAYAAGLAAPKWQPIDSAPKDETVVEIWSTTRGVCHNMFRYDYAPGNVFYDPVRGGPGCVRDATHWMPLPAAPESKP
jgi:hypothetical protein